MQNYFHKMWNSVRTKYKEQLQIVFQIWQSATLHWKMHQKEPVYDKPSLPHRANRNKNKEIFPQDSLHTRCTRLLMQFLHFTVRFPILMIKKSFQLWPFITMGSPMHMNLSLATWKQLQYRSLVTPKLVSGIHYCLIFIIRWQIGSILPLLRSNRFNMPGQ